LLIAFAPPPGTTVRSRCFRIRTGASRDTREISPKTNSSATRSPTTVIVTLGNDSTIFFSRSASLGCFVISTLRFLRLADLLTVRASLRNDPQHGIDSVSCVDEFHFDRNDCQGIQLREVFGEVDGIFFGGDESVRPALLAQL